MTFSVWCIHRRDIRKSRLLHFESAIERDRFVLLDPVHRVPLETCDGIPFCRLPETPPPRVKWISYEKREVKP
jgi:hypothetical protein